jgi:NAD(P)-dependent dehydrogenase (short-subunit alcohol dehydrogenase family)
MRVAIVTGAGSGLGRAYAFALAAQGMRIVVNDAGVALDGAGGGAGPAETVVEEIRARGGEAVANTGSVARSADVAALFDQAMDQFQRVDLVVNNAGIVRGAPVHQMSDDDWDAVVGVHLRGTFACCRAALARMRRTGGGRIINVVSGAAFGTPYPGTANYAAAKGGIISLTRVVAAEGAADGIACNAIAPIAQTRMSAQFLADDTDPRLAPERVARFVVFLAGAPVSLTGHVFRVVRGEVSIVRFGTMSAAVALIDDHDELARRISGMLNAERSEGV